MAQQDSFGFGNLDEMFRAMNEQMAQAQGQQNTQAQKNNNGNKKRRLLDEFGIKFHIGCWHVKVTRVKRFLVLILFSLCDQSSELCWIKTLISVMTVVWELC